MSKATTIAKSAKRVRTRKRASEDAAVAVALTDIKQLTPDSAKASQVLALLKSWLKDDSGYDEKTWPKLKKGLDQQRVKAGARRLFDE